MLRGLPVPEQRQLIEGVVHTLTTYQDELNQPLDRQEPAPNPDLSLCTHRSRTADRSGCQWHRSTRT